MPSDANNPLAQALAGLNKAQRRAVLWGEGPLLVLAGPGSGKTKVLTCRIARLLENSPDQAFRILALTFTNKAADEMRQRLEILAPGQADRLFLGTFHSFCAEVLRTHGTHVGVRPDFQIYSVRQDLEALVQEVLHDLERDDGLAGSAGPLGGIARLPEASSLVPILERLRGELVKPEHVGELFPAPQGQQMEAVYRGYDQKLRDLNAMDFGSLLYFTHELFARYPAMARHYRRVYPYWCLDEFQDTNGAQYQLLRAMAGDEFRNVCAVADDDQIIYEWNGASHRRLSQFRDDFLPDVVQLSTNYRCPAPVLELANRLISHNFARTAGKEPLQAGRVCEPGPERVRLQHLRSDEAEAEWLGKDIQRQGRGSADTAVLARNRSLLETIKDALHASGVSATLAQRRDEFLSPHFRWLQACLRQEVYRTENRNLATLVGAFSLLTPTGVTSPEDVQNRAGATQGDLLRAWVEMTRAEALDDSSARILAAVEDLLDGQDFRKFISSAVAWFATLEPQPENFSDYEEDLRAWSELWRDISPTLGPTSRLASFLQDLELRSKAPAPDPHAVRLMTIHSSKGLEFNHVYLAGLVEGILPSFQALKPGADVAQLEEERRNCFVAITRAKESLTISYADTYRGWKKKPSRFLLEMGLLA